MVVLEQMVLSYELGGRSIAEIKNQIMIPTTGKSSRYYRVNKRQRTSASPEQRVNNNKSDIYRKQRSCA